MNLEPPLLGIYPREMKTYIHKKPCVYKPALVCTSPSLGGKKPICSSVGDWIDQVWYICTVEYYSVVKVDDLLMRSTTLKTLRNIMLSEGSQTQKSIY